MTAVVDEVAVEAMTVKQSRAMFDRSTKAVLGIGRLEFLRRLDAGEYDSTDSDEVLRLILLAPYGR